MTVRIPPNIIVMLIETLLLIGVVVLFFTPALFGGPEITAAKNIAGMLEDACGKSSGTATFNEILPDSKGVNPPYFLSISVDQHNLILVARRGNNDIGGMIQDFLSCICAESRSIISSQLLKHAAEYVFRCSCKEGVRVLKTIPLKNCREHDVTLCGSASGSEERCEKFQLESREGYESLTFTVAKTKNPNKVVLSYSADVRCGDGRCCEPETSNSCPVDCPADGAGYCKILTDATGE